MRMIQLLGAAPRAKTVNWWRWFAIGIFGAVFLIFGSVLDAAKGGNPGKPGDTDPPDPPPESPAGVVYMWEREPGRGIQPIGVFQMNPDGSNRQLLFSFFNSTDGYEYSQIAASQHVYSTQAFPVGSRLFACVKRKSGYIEPSQGRNLSTGLVIIDEANNVLAELIGNDAMAVHPGSLVWYGEDQRLAFIGWEVTKLPPEVPSEQTKFTCDWTTMGVYTMDVSIDPSGLITHGSPELVPWTHDLFYVPDVYSNFEMQAIQVRTDALGDEWIYFTAPNRDNLDISPIDPGVYRTRLNDLITDFRQIERLDQPPLHQAYFEHFRIDPSGSIISGDREEGGKAGIVYLYIQTGDTVSHFPEAKTVDGWRSLTWSPTGEHIIFTQHRSWNGDSLLATAAFENAIKIYRYYHVGQAGIIGWCATP
ncbi:MAG TPA: hypothetical protein VK995_03660 [Oceanipulchritudo sp.]|nr:hypothetical protein [Oceanipulchritudo sp.]